MTTITPFLRNVLKADAAFSAVGAVLMAAGAPIVAPLTGLPPTLLIGAGLALVPWVALLVYIVRQPGVSRLVMIDVIAVNALWAAVSVGLLVSGMIAPNALGAAFVLAQALVVAVFAELQFVGMRRAQTAAA